MSYDVEYNSRRSRDSDVKKPLLNQGQTFNRGGAASPIEIQENLEKISKNVGRLVTFSNNIERGMIYIKVNGLFIEKDHSSMQILMADTSKFLLKCKELLDNYSKADKDSYMRKFNTV